MSQLVSLTKDGDVAVITIDNPPVNALSPGVPEGILSALDEAERDDAVRAIVLIGAGRTFIAGADIREFEKMTSGQKQRGHGLHPVIERLENSPKPVVCAIHGTAFGGGLEVAMSCHYRIAVPGAQVGQPEVKLGIIPGAGGTQRLPRLAGVARAVEMCATGEPVKAPDALAAGIVDRLIDGDLLSGAVAFAREQTAPRRTRDLPVRPDPAAVAAAREQARKKMRGMTAPQRAIDAVEAATRLSFDDGIREEARIFQECLLSDQSKALIHVFFGEREVAKIPDVPKDTPVLPIRKAAIVGAGTMGGGIAMAYANAGIPIVLKEADNDALSRGLTRIRSNYAGSVERGRLTQAEADARFARIRPTLSYDGFQDADIVVEAVFEGMELKKQVFAELDKVARADAILASNTSTLNIDEIASATSRPRMVIGHHFFSPANVMRLLEIVRGKQTSREVLATSMALAKRLGKVGVLVGNCRGFVGNRMFGPYRREAQFLVEEGASPEAVDGALVEYGMAMGPLATGDLAGLDVGWRIRKEYRHLETPGMRQPMIEDRLCELGRYGQKTGAGWYKYDATRKPSHDPVVDGIIEECRRAAGVPQRSIDPSEIVDRCIYALVNEGARILEEGFALRAVDVDIIYGTGYGFPAWRGGPMWYADTVGLRRVYDRVREFEQQQGAWWTPAPLLKRLAEEGGTFAAFAGRARGQESGAR